jgi:phosphoribosyl 1,2-cyclic phosphodiesterase
MAERSSSNFNLRFWGARGSIPVPGERTVRYGGNTACIEIRAGPNLIIVDCGSGAYALGADLLERGVQSAELLITHTHLDHLLGFPFFKPAYDPSFRLRCWSARQQGHEGLEQTLRAFVDEAFSPAGVMAAVNNCTFEEFSPGGAIDLAAGCRVRTQALNHPGGAVGYRVDFDGRSIAVVSDHEHGDPSIDAAVRLFVEGADVMIYDATYTQEEYDRYKGWGHSTWQEAVALANTADVRIPVLFHHLPERDDAALDAIVEAARRSAPRLLAAKEGMTIALG